MSSKADDRRLAVMYGVLNGKTNAVIAQELGCTERRVEQIRAEPEISEMLGVLLKKKWGRVTKLFDKTLKSIDSGLDMPAFDMFGKIVNHPETGKPLMNNAAHAAARRDLIAILKLADDSGKQNQAPTSNQTLQIIYVNNWRAASPDNLALSASGAADS